MITSAEKELAIVLEMLGFSKNGKCWEHAYSKKKPRDLKKMEDKRSGFKVGKI